MTTFSYYTFLLIVLERFELLFKIPSEGGSYSEYNLILISFSNAFYTSGVKSYEQSAMKSSGLKMSLSKI